MSVLIIILLIIALLIIVLLVLAALLSDNYTIEQNTIINQPVSTVFNYVKYLENQGNYNKWVLMDPNVRKEFKGIDGTVGFFYAWESDNKQVGKGEQTITGITNNKRVDYHLKFLQPFQSEAESYIETESLTGGQTRVTWVFGGKRNFMMKVMHTIFNLKKMLGKDLQTSLQNLKAILEK